MQNVLLRACSSLFARTEKESYLAGFHVDFSKMGIATQLNGRLLEERLQGVLEAKNYENKDMLFLFRAVFIDRCTGWWRKLH